MAEVTNSHILAVKTERLVAATAVARNVESAIHVTVVRAVERVARVAAKHLIASAAVVPLSTLRARKLVAAFAVQPTGLAHHPFAVMAEND